MSRVAALLRIVAGNQRDGLRLVDIVEQSGLETPTAHRVLKALVDEGLLKRDELSRRYYLGPLVFELGLAAEPADNLQAVCEQSVIRLAQLSGDVAMLAVRNGYDTVCLDRREGDHPVRALTVQVGTRRPLGVGAASLAILAALPKERIAHIIEVNALRFWQFNGLTGEMLWKLVDATRQAGYAHTRGELFPDIGGVGLAVRNSQGEAIAAFGISTTITRLSAERVAHLLKLLRSEVAFVEAALRSSQTISKSA